MQRREKETRKKLRYDANEGLLPEIRKHCGYTDHRVEEATTSRATTKKKKPVEEEWKWPEAQICSICAIGGDILCCETCPASFHFSCIGFEASDFPDDNYYCNRCQNTPKGVQLFPPEKCAKIVCTQSRTEVENERNFDAIQYQYNRLKQEEADENLKKGIIGPKTEMETLASCFPDLCALKALGMANQMDYTLPPDYLLEREFEPDDSLEERRPTLVGEVCADCGLKDDWTSMLRCDYCDLIYHLKCVKPTLVYLPKMSYWRCSRHTKSLIDSMFQGEEISRQEKNRLNRKYNDIDTSFESFEMLCKSTEHLRIEAKLREFPLLREIYYKPEEEKTASIFSMLNQKKHRKGVRTKKKDEQRFFDNAFSIVGAKDQSTSKASKTRQKSPELSERKDRDLDKLDQKRSQKFTEEDLLMSIMPFEEKARNEHISMKRGGTDMEVLANVLNRQTAIVVRSKTLLGSLSEKELARMMKESLDPVETVRGSGVQIISAAQEKAIRKKLKLDAELLIKAYGVGTDHWDRSFNSYETEAFFRRCAPPPTAQDTLNQKTLRQSIMNSQKEAYEVSRVYKFHPMPKNLNNLILLGYDTHFQSKKERDEYFVPSMTPWSKEPIGALTAKWAEESRAVEMKLKESIAGTSTSIVEPNAGDSYAKSKSPIESKTEDQQGPSSSVFTESEAKLEDRNEEVEKIDEDDVFNFSPSSRQGPISASAELSHRSSPIYRPPDSPISLFEKLALLDFKGLRMQEEYEKAETIHEAEGYFGEPDEALLDDTRTCKSENDLIPRAYWPAVQKHLQNMALRSEQYENEHNYSQVNAPTCSANVDCTLSLIHLPTDLHDEKLEDDDKESSYSVEFAYPNSLPEEPYENFAEPVRKRGRPVGSKNRKDGEAPSKRKRNSVGSTSSSRGGGRGRSGRPRGSRGRGAGGSRSIEGSIDGEGPSRRQSQTLSSDAPESPEPADNTITEKLRQEVEEAKKKYTKLFVMKSFENSKQAYFETRDNFLLNWTDEQRREHREVYLTERLRSLIPYEQRYFITSERVFACLEINNQHLPIAIQRCLTKFGRAQDCHVLLYRYTENCCSVFADYHCDIVREHHSNTFFLSTLATNFVIVDGIVVRRPRLTHMEAAERLQAKITPKPHSSNLRCQCQVDSDQLIAHQENRGMIQNGIVKLEDGAEIQIGCASFTFKKI